MEYYSRRLALKQMLLFTLGGSVHFYDQYPPLIEKYGLKIYQGEPI